VSVVNLAIQTVDLMAVIQRWPAWPESRVFMTPLMRKSLSMLIPLAWGICALASPALAGQQRKPAMNNEQKVAIYGLIRQVERQTRVFDAVVKPSLKTSALAQSKDRRDLLGLADNMRYEALQVKRDFEAGRSNDLVIADLSELFVSAEQVNVIAGNVTLGPQADGVWPDLRDAVNNLGLVYGLQPLSSESVVGE
jgi:hypothetical protein